MSGLLPRTSLAIDIQPKIVVVVRFKNEDDHFIYDVTRTYDKYLLASVSEYVAKWIYHNETTSETRKRKSGECLDVNNSTACLIDLSNNVFEDLSVDEPMYDNAMEYLLKDIKGKWSLRETCLDHALDCLPVYNALQSKYGFAKCDRVIYGFLSKQKHLICENGGPHMTEYERCSELDIDHLVSTVSLAHEYPGLEKSFTVAEELLRIITLGNYSATPVTPKSTPGLPIEIGEKAMISKLVGQLGYMTLADFMMHSPDFLIVLEESLGMRKDLEEFAIAKYGEKGERLGEVTVEMGAVPVELIARIYRRVEGNHLVIGLRHLVIRQKKTCRIWASSVFCVKVETERGLEFVEGYHEVHKESLDECANRWPEGSTIDRHLRIRRDRPSMDWVMYATANATQKTEGEQALTVGRPELDELEFCRVPGSSEAPFPPLGGWVTTIKGAPSTIVHLEYCFVDYNYEQLPTDGPREYSVEHHEAKSPSSFLAMERYFHRTG